MSRFLIRFEDGTEVETADDEFSTPKQILKYTYMTTSLAVEEVFKKVYPDVREPRRRLDQEAAESRG